MTKLSSRAQRQQGSIMIESLVAILLFSLGVLAFVGQQLSALKYVADSRYRTEAAVWADTLIAEMTVAPQGTLMAQYAGGGPAFVAWRNRVMAAGTGLPGATVANVTLALAPGVTPLSFDATVSVGWQVRGNEQAYGAGDQLGGVYTTTTTLY